MLRKWTCAGTGLCLAALLVTASVARAEDARTVRPFNGVDLKGWRGGLTSAAHTQADIDFTLEAWRRSLRDLKEEGLLR